MEALASLSREYEGFYQQLLISVKERVAGGAGLHRALEDFGDFFPDFYISMIQAGEMSGSLDRVLTKLSDFLERQQDIRSKVRSAMIYPLLMMGVSIVVLSFLFTFVIPKIVKIFKDTQSTLPPVTQVLIFVSNVFTNYWWLLIIVVALIAALVKRFVRTQRPLVDRLLLSMPGGVMKSLCYGRFARTMAFLLEGGLPVLKALSLSAKSTGNTDIEASVRRAAERVTEGQRLSAALDGFPPVFLQLVATGEKSGRLPETLNKAADSYEDEFSRSIGRVVALFEPLMILVMGLVVGFIVLAVLLPMFQLNQLIK